MGNWSSARGRGKGIAFLRAHVADEDGDCLIWPMSRNKNGYALFGFEGKLLWAHRFICEMVHGPAPSPNLQAAHSCGRGKDGCVHPKHLSWKTKSGNLLDAVAHGTHAGNVYGNRGQLKPAQVTAIRRLKGQMTQEQIALAFGITEPTVRDIYLGRTYRSVPILSEEREISDGREQL